MPTDVPAEVLAALARLRVDEDTPADALLHVAAAACSVAPADAAAVRLLLAGRPVVGACTDDTVARFDDLQHHLGQGPAVQALEGRDPVVVPALVGDSRWPELCPAGVDPGMGSAVAVPLRAHDRPIGCLTVYGRAPGSFDAGAVARVRLFARHAAPVVANLQVYWEARQLADNLQQALDSRATIDHAIGILMAGGSPSPSDAFQVLVRASQRQNRKLRDIAADIVARATERNRRHVAS